MADIFICYRRADAPGYAGRLADALAERFPAHRVFRDIEGLEPGTDYTQVITATLGSCAGFLAVIGPDWLEPGPAGRPRLFDADDPVRQEIAAALKRSGCVVIPVLVGGAVMPHKAELPPELERLKKLQAQEITERHWDADVASLAAILEKRAGLRSSPGVFSAFRVPRGWKWSIAAVLLSIFGLAAVTWLTIHDKPVLSGDLSMLDLRLVDPGIGASCIKPLNCDEQDPRDMSEVIRLRQSEARADAAKRELHLLLDVQWVLREGRTKLFHRAYVGTLHYVIEYQRSEPSGQVVVGRPVLREYSLAPVSGLIAYALGWIEMPFLAERTDSIATEVRRRLDDAAVVQALP